MLGREVIWNPIAFVCLCFVVRLFCFSFLCSVPRNCWIEAEHANSSNKQTQIQPGISNLAEIIFTCFILKSARGVCVLLGCIGSVLEQEKYIILLK